MISKRTIAIIFFIIISFASKSQNVGYKSEDFTLSGEIGVNSVINDNNDGYNFSVNYGYFVTDRVSAGIGFGFKGGEQNKNDFSFNLNSRYYHHPENKLSFFGNLGLIYSSTRLNDIKTNNYKISLSPGISYFINNIIAIEAIMGQIGYKYSNTNEDNSIGKSTFSIGCNLSNIQFGIILRHRP